jgi:hypothetical protein
MFAIAAERPRRSDVYAGEEIDEEIVANKHDMRDGLPGHADPLIADRLPKSVTQDELNREQDARVSTEPQLVTPEPGKNVPEGQNTKG